MRAPATALNTSGITPWRFALVLALAIFAAFPNVLLGLETFVIRDFGFFAYPLAHYQRECFWRGELPLWNPYNHCGLPFLAQWNTMPLYPPSLLYLLLPLPWSLNFFCLIHLFWAGLGMFFLARRWTGSGTAAAVAGMAFAFNGFALNLLMWPSHIATFSWMPWVVLTVEPAWRSGGRKLVVAALAGTLQMLAGGPETILFTWLLLLALWLAQLLQAWKNRQATASNLSWTSLAWRFPCIVTLVSGLAAAQLLPFLDLATHSQREQGFADARWSMPSSGWMNFLVPMAFGSVNTQGVFFQHGQFWTSSYYLGIGLLLLVFLGLSDARNKRVWLLAAAAIIGLLLATGDHTLFSRWARQLLPQLTLITYPVKFILLVVFAAPLLAAFGMQWLEQSARPSPPRRFLIVGCLLLVLIAVVLFWAWRFPIPRGNLPATVLNGVTRAVFLIGIAAIIWLLLGATLPPAQPRSKLRSPLSTSVVHALLPVVLIVLLWLDVLTHQPPQNPTVPNWIYAPSLARTNLAMTPQPELGASRAMMTPDADERFRGLALSDPKDNYLVKRLGYFADCNLLDAVPTVNGFFSIAPRECGELYSVLYASRRSFSPGLPDFLSVSQATAPGEHTKWHPRDTFLPLATAGQRPVFLDDTNAILTLLGPNFDPRKIVLLPPQAQALISVANQTKARITGSRFTAHQVDLAVAADQPSLVVLSQTFYHPWKAYVDNEPQALFRANYAFQAVQVPAGEHRVRIAYEDRAFRIGATCSGLSILLCAGLWVLARRTAGEPNARPAIK